MGMELEFKLAVKAPALLEQILFDKQIAEVRQGSYRLIDMATIYYDTPDRRLSTRMWTLRLRQEDDVFVCTFKTALEGLSRLELDCQAETIEEGAALLADNPHLPEGARQALLGGVFVPTCGAKFTRQVRLCRVEDSTFELCADMGRLFNGQRTQELREIELELTEREYEILRFMAQTPGRVISRQELMTEEAKLELGLL